MTDIWWRYHVRYKDSAAWCGYWLRPTDWFIVSAEYSNRMAVQACLDCLDAIEAGKPQVIRDKSELFYPRPPPVTLPTLALAVLTGILVTLVAVAVVLAS